LVSIEPFPSEFLIKDVGIDTKLIKKSVQEISLDFFEKLQPGDFLFIDSSHVSKVDSDVNYLFLHIIPKLKPGVIIHIHDIFLPYEFEKTWIEGLRFWNEQYLLHVMLMGKSNFKILLGNWFLLKHHPDKLKNLYEEFEDYPTSFWIQKLY